MLSGLAISLATAVSVTAPAPSYDELAGCAGTYVDIDNKVVCYPLTASASWCADVEPGAAFVVHLAKDTSWSEVNAIIEKMRGCEVTRAGLALANKPQAPMWLDLDGPVQEPVLVASRSWPLSVAKDGEVALAADAPLAKVLAGRTSLLVMDEGPASVLLARLAQRLRALPTLRVRYLASQDDARRASCCSPVRHNRRLRQRRLVASKR